MSGTQGIPGTGTQGKPRPTPNDALIGRTLQQGEYFVESVIGQGGMGQVFLASHRALDVPVALKRGRADQPLPESVKAELDRLLRQKPDTPQTPAQPYVEADFPLSGGASTDRFLREALLLARLSHPAIPTLYDYFFEEGYWYLVMEYLPGPTLAAHIRQYAPLPPLEALNYAMQLCDVLDYLHRQTPAIVFRDLKPSNVILSPEGRLMLVDFGIARYFKEGQINDTTDFGSPGYAPPELYEGSGQTDGRSDLYSLGVILHEMVSGLRPARTSTRGGKLESLYTINPALSPALRGLVTVATRPEPMYRFQTAYAFYQAMERTREIEERRAYQRYALLATEAPRTPSQALPTANTAAQGRNRPSLPSRQAVASSQRSQQAHMREHLNKARRERLEQEALAMQLASLDESLKQRVVSVALATPAPLGEDDIERPARPKLRRALQALFIIALLLSLILTSLFALDHFAHRTQSPTPGRTLTATTYPTLVTQSSWQALASIPSPQADNTASYIVLQGKAYIYISGGYRGIAARPQYSRGLFRYDIASAHWETLSDKGFPIMGNNAAAVDDHQHIFFTGGFSTDTQSINSALYLYQPENGTLLKITPPPQIVIGFGSSMLADQQGHLYITGGFTLPGNPQARASSGWYRYDIASGQWAILTPLPLGLGYVTLAPDGQGGILLIGGARDAGQRDATSSIYRYDIARNAWTQEASSAPTKLSGATSCLDGTDHLILIGGYDASHNAALAQVWRLTLRTLNWQALPTLLSGGSQLGAAACDGKGNIYLERGANSAGKPTSDFLELSLSS